MQVSSNNIVGIYQTPFRHHGEPDLPPPPPVIDNTRQPQMSDMTALLNDLSYIPPNNEHNEPTQGDIGETSNEPTQDTRNEFEELYDSANEELYLGCDYVTRLDFMAKFTYFKVKGKLTDSIFNEIHTAKEMIRHATGKCTEPGKMQHPVGGRAWKKFDTKYPDFAKEPRNVRLGLAAFGFNPFGNLSQAYSMWLVILATYNLPLWLCMKESSFRLTLLIPGPKSPGKDIDVYLRPLIEDLDPPKEFCRDEILAQLDRLPTRVKGKHPSYGGVKIKRNVHVELNWTKRSIFYELECWSFLLLRHNLDIMHIEKNVLDAILNTLLMNDKSKDTAKARQDLKMLGIRSGLWLGQTKSGKCLKPQAQYLPDKISKPIIELCFLFKQICSATLMKNDMLKAQIKVVDILCDLELIYPPALFDIMIHLVIHLPLEALEGGPIRPRPEIDTYRSQFKSRDERRTTQNSSICSPSPDEEMYYDKAKPHWKVVEHVNHKKFSDGGVIVVEDDPDIIYFDNSPDLPLSTSLNDLDNATLHIDGQSTKVDTPPDIIDVVDEDDDIIDEEDVILYDLADSDDEDLINVDDDGVDKMLHGPTAVTMAVKIVPHHTMYPVVAGVASLTEEITDTKGPVPIRFEVCDKQTLMPLGEHAAHCSSYIGEVIRGVPLYHPSWLKVPKERKARLIADVGIQFDLRPHIESPDWTEIHVGIQQHLKKVYNTNKAAFKAQHWVIDPTNGTYNVEKIRRGRPQNITTDEWDKGRAQPLRSTRRSLTPSSWHTLLTGNFFGMRTDEEMRRLEATGTYTDDEISHLAKGGKQRGHILGVGRVLSALATTSPSTPAHESTLNSLHKKVDFMTSLFKSDSKYSDMFSQFESGGASGSGGYWDDENSADDQDDEDEDGNGDT
nr:hypothetical protein [Tanacetum cinerariifolium]